MSYCAGLAEEGDSVLSDQFGGWGIKRGGDFHGKCKCRENLYVGVIISLLPSLLPPPSSPPPPPSPPPLPSC